MRSPVRLVRNSDAARLFDTFLISAVITVLGTRLYLHFTGYPQIGGDSTLHIAHMLPGGILMVLAILILVGTINHSSRQPAAFLGGIGFGLFWDELGKFITKDNDYFFQPTIGLIYLSFVGIYLATRYVIRRSYHPHDYLANAVDLAMEGVIGELDPREYEQARALLSKADPDHPMYHAALELLEATKPTKTYRPFIIERITDWVHQPFKALVRRPWFSKLLVGVFYIYGIGMVGGAASLLFISNTGDLARIITTSEPSSIVAVISFSCSALFVLLGLWHLQFKQQVRALQRFETALLINIFITQACLFFSYQLSAIISLLATLLLLVTVRIILTETTDQP